MPLPNDWLLTPHRVAVHLPTRTAVVADLHLGYAEARRQGGDSIPSVPLDTILQPLHDALAANAVQRLVIAGDLFEKTYLPTLWHQLLAWLQQRDVELAAVVPGNHDRAWTEPAPLHPDGYPLADWLIVHGHLPTPAKRLILGHWHPAMHYRGALSPCYLLGDREIVLPAYSQDAAGVNVWPLTRWQGYRCLVIDGPRVADVGPIRRPPNTPSTTPRRKTPWQGRLRPS